jgi:hypothetical protein
LAALFAARAGGHRKKNGCDTYDHDDLIALVITHTGWSWEYAENLESYKLEALMRVWTTQCPPVSMSVAHFLGFKPQQVQSVGAAPELIKPEEFFGNMVKLHPGTPQPKYEQKIISFAPPAA